MTVMKTVMFASFVVLGACVSEPLPMDPVGTWDNLYSWTSGDCALTTPSKFPLSVLKASDSLYIISDPDPHVTAVTGTMHCMEDNCAMTIHEEFTGTTNGVTTSGSVDASLTLDETNSILGGGTMKVWRPDGFRCSQKFNASGALR